MRRFPPRNHGQNKPVAGTTVCKERGGVGGSHRSMKKYRRERDLAISIPGRLSCLYTHIWRPPPLYISAGICYTFDTQTEDFQQCQPKKT